MPEAENSTPQGLYLVGEVGRGKSMLMDLFFASAEVRAQAAHPLPPLHADSTPRIHAWGRPTPGARRPDPALADTIAGEATLLCFDEFQVTDIADAMILGRLFEALFDRGVVVVATSNPAPDDLYKGKPGRDAFLPFIALIKDRLDVLELDAARDYRRDRSAACRPGTAPVDGRAGTGARRRLSSNSPGCGTAKPCTLSGARPGGGGAGGGARGGAGEVDDLCGKPLGAADYLALATHSHTLVLDGVPRLGAGEFRPRPAFHHPGRCAVRAPLQAGRLGRGAAPDLLYEQGENAAMFERTASRLDGDAEPGISRASQHLT